MNPEDGGARRLRHLLGAVELPGASARRTTATSASASTTFISAGPVHADRLADQSVPERRQQPRRQHARRADRRRRRDRVHRSGQERAVHPAGTRSTSRASSPATSRSASSTSAPPAVTSASAARTTASSTSTRCRSAVPVARRRALNDQVPNPFFGLPAGQGFNVTSATIQRRAVAASVPAVRRHPDAADHAAARTSTTPRSSSSKSA